MSGALTVAQACARYSISRSTLHRLRRTAGFPQVRIGRKVLIPVAAAERWFDENLEVAS